MLLFEHFIAASTIHGLGVFTSESIAAGRTIWKFNPLVDNCISIDDLGTLPAHIQHWVKERAHLSEKYGGMIIGCDGDLFMNHSENPNMTADDGDCYAIRDIAANEEVTCDYRLCTVMIDHSAWGSAR